MPAIIKHIDKISREKQRGVLFVIFHKILTPSDTSERKIPFEDVDWRELPIRAEIIKWLDEQGFAWERCGEFASENVMCSYRGQIYIDIPFDRSNPDYLKIEAYLENPDGSMRYPDATFCYLPLDRAMQNAYHDEPGFWEKWAEKF
ncbi:hypothetical protein [Chitinilyticum aquatile]|uniref:hypothetical protein n=1 Tax=Chitinilyticum aquatile TaxID=362520 RepID=UPI0003F67DE7|nr:hypothetical protein [Chitinilyticum aquatile]